MVSLKQFVLSVAYKEFEDYLDKQIGFLHTSIELSRSVEDIYRLQGQIFALKKLKNMRDDLLQRDK